MAPHIFISLLLSRNLRAAPIECLFKIAPFCNKSGISPGDPALGTRRGKLGSPTWELDSQLFWEGGAGSRSLPRAEPEGSAAQSRVVKNFARSNLIVGTAPLIGALVA